MASRPLAELLHGIGAHADPVACIEDLPFEFASRQAEACPHSIAQLIFHMNYWMDHELRRIRGQKPVYPEHNAESFPPSPSPRDAADWDQMRRRFAELLNDFSALTNSSPEEMQRQIESVHDGDKKFRAPSKRCSGRWLRTTAITSARSPSSAARSPPGRPAPAETPGRKPPSVVCR